MSNYDLQKLQSYLFSRFPDGNFAGADRDQWQVVCPRCRDEAKKAYINIRTGAAICFQCRGWQFSNWWQLIASVEGLPGSRDAENWFSSQSEFSAFVYDTSERLYQDIKVLDRTLPVGYKQYNVMSAELDARPYVEYIVSRLPSFDRRLVPYFQFGYCTTGKYEGRLIFPVVYQGKLEFFVDRLVPSLHAHLPDQPPKTLGIGSTAKQEKWPVPKGSVVYNLEFAELSVRRNDSAVIEIVEGVFSALSCQQYPAVALLGKKCTDLQLKRLLDTGAMGFVLTLDAGTEQETASLADRLTNWGRRVFVRHLDPQVGDPNDYLVKRVSLPDPVEWGMKEKMDALMRGWIHTPKPEGVY